MSDRERAEKWLIEHGHDPLHDQDDFPGDVDDLVELLADQRRRDAEELAELDISMALGSTKIEIERDDLLALLRRWNPELVEQMKRGDASVEAGETSD